MKAEIYHLKVSESVMDLVHNVYKEINELYIPQHKVSCNIVNDTLNIFRTAQDRYRNAKLIKKVEISKTLIERILFFLEEKQKIKKALKEIFLLKEEKRK